MATAAAAANGEVPPQPNPAPTKEQQKKMNKMKKKRSSSSDNDEDNDGSYDPRTKKTFLHPPVVGSKRDLHFEEFVMKLSEWTSGFRGAFPQDEKEAAILLMALSYGLVLRANNNIP
ncbi:hypothetical protein MLD38_006220 [Melastoma candidum]|uniref:Uncharacterized protein n=1 Tax=Melastoma candidum TaxID=119954 RepID=A0ACB9RQ84_9MYRT|nr:hypothetical protein MLD38_006220 [Melastoma candidum]